MKIEKLVCLILIIFMINNLYFLSVPFGISKEIPVAIIGVIALCFFVIRLKDGFYVNKLINIFSFPVIIISLLLFFFTIIFDNNVGFTLNDFTRIVILSSLFNWAYYLNNTKKEFITFVNLISAISLIIVSIQSVFEYFYPGIFRLLFINETIYFEIPDFTTVRLAGTLRDANTYACALVLYVYLLFEFYFKQNQKKYLYYFLLLIITVAINLSGSRQGLISLLILFIYSLYTFGNSLKSYLINFLAICGIVSTFLIYNFLINSSDYTAIKNTAVYRSFDSSGEAESSSVHRIKSLYDGMQFIIENGIFSAPGSILFQNKWEKFTSEVAPHNAFVYLIAQFGIYSLIILVLIIYSFYLTCLHQGYILALLTFIQILLLPNSIYYGVFFLSLFTMDIFIKFYAKIHFKVVK